MILFLQPIKVTQPQFLRVAEVFIGIHKREFITLLLKEAVNKFENLSRHKTEN